MGVSTPFTHCLHITHTLSAESRSIDWIDILISLIGNERVGVYVLEGTGRTAKLWESDPVKMRAALCQKQG